MSGTQPGKAGTDAKRVPRIALAVGYGALVPLIVAAVLAATGGAGLIDEAEADTAFLVYALLLIAFQGGVRSGHELRARGMGSVALAGLAALAIAAALWFAPIELAFGIAAMAFAAQGAHDVWSAEVGRLPYWYGRLRLQTAPIAIIIAVTGLLLTASG